MHHAAPTASSKERSESSWAEWMYCRWTLHTSYSFVGCYLKLLEILHIWELAKDLLYMDGFYVKLFLLLYCSMSAVSATQRFPNFRVHPKSFWGLTDNFLPRPIGEAYQAPWICSTYIHLNNTFTHETDQGRGQSKTHHSSTPNPLHLAAVHSEWALPMMTILCGLRTMRYL